MEGRCTLEKCVLEKKRKKIEKCDLKKIIINFEEFEILKPIFWLSEVNIRTINLLQFNSKWFLERV